MTTQQTIQQMRRATKQAAASAAENTPDTDETGLTVGPILPAIIRMPALTKYVGDVTSRTIWRWVRRGEFPQPIDLPSGLPAWRMDDVSAWLATLKPRGRS